MRPDICSTRSRIISPQVPWVLASPFSAVVRFFVSWLTCWFSSMSRFSSSFSDRRSVVSLRCVSSIFFWKSLSRSRKGLSSSFSFDSLVAVNLAVFSSRIWLARDLKVSVKRFSVSATRAFSRASFSALLLAAASSWASSSLMRAARSSSDPGEAPDPLPVLALGFHLGQPELLQLVVQGPGALLEDGLLAAGQQPAQTDADDQGEEAEGEGDEGRGVHGPSVAGARQVGPRRGYWCWQPAPTGV